MELTIGKVEAFDIEDYLDRRFTCECGREHSVGIERVIIEKGAIERLPHVLEDFKYREVFMVADNNTYEAAGQRVEEILICEGYNVKKLIYEREGKLVPDERAIGEFFTSYEKNIDVIVTIGSGVLSDISKYMSYMLETPSIMVATAPSMDGYASVGSAFILKGTKKSLESLPPKAIIADIDVLREAPMDMIIAGLGDMLGKYSSLRDWKLASIVTGEYYCDVVREMVNLSLNRCIQNIQGFTRRDGETIGYLMEGLVLVGIAMSFVGNSRPASGSEHHMSHFWELISLMDGRRPVAHGIQVGIATLLTSRLAESLIDMDIDFDDILRQAEIIDQDRWEREIHRIYKGAAPEIIKLNKKPIDDEMRERKERAEAIRDNWPYIVDAIKEAPRADEIEQLFKKAGEDVSIRPEDVGFDREIIQDTILYAKEIRQRYTILQLLWDMGLLEQFAYMDDLY